MPNSDEVQDNLDNVQSFALMAYRMGIVEKDVKNILGRFDTVAQYYVTNATLMLSLEPLKERVVDLESNEKDREKARHGQQAQFKLAIAIAVLSPLLSIVVNLIINVNGS